MNWAISFDPFLPWLAIAGLAATSLAIALVLGFFQVRGTVLRSLAMAALVMALANPVLKQEDRQPLDSTVVIAVDKSASQAIAGRIDDTEEAADHLVDLLDRLPGLNPVRVDLEEGDFAAEGTRLFSTLEQALTNIPSDAVAGAVLVTDGLLHDVPDTIERLGFQAPLHALITGDAGQFDRRIVPVRTPRYGIVGQVQMLEVRVDDVGVKSSASQGLDITIAVDGEELMVERARAGDIVRIPIDITHAGANIITLNAAPLVGEVTTLNNQLVVPIEGIRENLRVLLVSGEPHAGERTWRNLLKSDASVDLVHFTILRPPEKQDGTPINQLSLIAFPTRELFSEKIEDFDLIIFDRYQRRGVLPLIYFDNIADYVRNGGAVLVASGPDYASQRSLFRTPLAGILPAEPTGQTVEAPYVASLTSDGLRHPVTRGLPGSESEPPTWSRWFRLVEATALSGNTIMHGPDDRPLLILDRIGEGRVALMLSDHAWLWARGFEGGGPHVPLLRRIAHWLMAEPELEEERLTLRQSGNRIVIVRQSMTEVPPDVLVTGPDGSETLVPLQSDDDGLWRGMLAMDNPGLYQATSGDSSTMASIGPPNPLEFSDVMSTGERLQPIVEASRGTIVDLAQSGLPRIVPIRGGGPFSGRGWIGVEAPERYVVTGIRSFSLFAGFLGLALLLGALAAAWYREGR